MPKLLTESGTKFNTVATIFKEAIIKNYKNKSKIKKFKKILIMIYKLIIDTLFSNSIFFINNYFFKLKIIKKFIIIKIIIYEIIKLN